MERGGQGGEEIRSDGEIEERMSDGGETAGARDSRRENGEEETDGEARYGEEGERMEKRRKEEERRARGEERRRTEERIGGEIAGETAGEETERKRQTEKI